MQPPAPTKAKDWGDVARSLEKEGWWLADLCGLDRLSLGGDHRFVVVVQLLQRERRARKTVHVAAAGDPPAVPSIVEVWPSAANMEREAFDMFGIRFEGHPNLSRILMPDEWEGHPLRKDYGVGKVPVEFVPQPFMQVDSPGQSPQSEEARRAVDALGQSGQPRRHSFDSPAATPPGEDGAR
ncbi:MAG: NADH-quinone oxidoreductase subunit C [Actinomycetota bacterium]